MSAPALDTVHLASDEVELLAGLARDLPSAASSEAAVVDWVERELGARQSDLSPGLAHLRRAIADRSHLVHVTGLGLADDLPDTPSAITPREDARLSSHDLAHLLVATQAGVVFGCDHTQGGRLANDIFSVPGAVDNTAQSQAGFRFHVDGAMDPETAPQYFSMQCLRNSEEIPTFASTVDRNDFDDETWRLLTAPVYTIRFDPRVPRSTDLTGSPMIDATPDGGVARLSFYDDTTRVRVEADDPEPYLTALDRMREVLNRDAVEVVLAPGDILLVDNLTTVHGRRGSAAPITTPGRQRWMRRFWITTDEHQIDRVRQAPGRVLRSDRGPR